MSKYDFEIDLSPNSSTGLILSALRPGSRVLEFGCAAGRMTRHMAREMGCAVCIVELDPEAFQQALPHAAEGLCDDIMSFRWAEKFADRKFDAVIFADVLEHLSDPERVLAAAGGLLEEDGRVFISLPNITHNDIILKACGEHFDYSSTGLLDESHIRFWGLENIRALSGKNGLFVESIKTTRCSTGSTEQAPPPAELPLLENLLRRRPCGEVYQFVITMSRRECAAPECSLPAPAATAHLYFDRGSGFSPGDCLPLSAPLSPDGSYVLEHSIPAEELPLRLRLDPVEGQGCLLSCSFCQNGVSLQPEGPGLLATEQGYLLPGGDPMVWVSPDPKGGELSLRARFLLPGPEFMEQLEQQLRGKSAQLERSLDRCGLLEKQLEDGRRQLEDGRRQRELLRGELELARAELSGYVSLATSKEKQLIEAEQRLALYSSPRYMLKTIAKAALSKLLRLPRRLLRAMKNTIKNQGKGN